ncbi:MAG: VTT domain-containing protein [Pseudomonadota bacterium]|nr:VTT domain-containing protein [Pseudomonadota bacterium]
MWTTIAFSATSLGGLLDQWVLSYGVWALALVALLIFLETGLVVLPFLPGDSLLFITGTVIAAHAIPVYGVVLVLAAAAVAGDALNFTIGRHAAPCVLSRLRGRWLRQAHLDATHRYFDRYGAATIVVARFVPIVRTLAPFLAGAGEMSYGRFAVFNVTGAVLWVGMLLYAGAWLGHQPFVKTHLSAITLGIVALSVLPMAVTALRRYRAERRRSARGERAAATCTVASPASAAPQRKR